MKNGENICVKLDDSDTSSISQAFRELRYRDTTHLTLQDLTRRFAAGEFEFVLSSVRALLADNPNNGHLWKLKGAALFELHSNAVYALRQAVTLLPNDAEAHNNLGAALQVEGNLAEAECCYRHAVQIDTTFVDAHHNLGAVLLQQYKYEDAVLSYRAVIGLATYVGEAHNELGIALQHLGRPSEAAVAFQKSVELSPTGFAALSNLGGTLVDMDRLEEAVYFCQKAITIRPDFSAGHNNLGTAFKAQGKLALSFVHYVQALTLNPNYTEAHRNAALVAHDMGRHSDCQLYINQALALEPANDRNRYAWGLICLQNGDLPAGWGHYESRWAGAITPARKLELPLPVWQGEPLQGKTLLVWGEQGVGDQVLFASMLPEMLQLAGHSGRCVVACTEKLLPLFARSFPSIEFLPLSGLEANPRLRDADVQCPMGSLAKWLRPELSAFQEQSAFLKADAGRVAYWAQRLATMGPEPKIGIAWRSANLKGERRLQFSSLDQWGSILTLPGVQFINLQNGDCTQEMSDAYAQVGVRIHKLAELDLHDNLDDTGALMCALDLVIGNTTATGRLSAALGVPTWALRYAPGDWTCLGTDHTPWLPALRYFTKTWDQSWETVIENLAQTLVTEGVPGRGKYSV